MLLSTLLLTAIISFNIGTAKTEYKLETNPIVVCQDNAMNESDYLKCK